MKKFPIILDLETKYTFRQFSDPKKLGISVVAIYDYQDNQKKVFLENEINRLFPILESSSYIIGYNVRSFDLPVLQGYYLGRIEQLPVFDILDDIKEKINKRLALNDILQATLNKKKTGHGLQAIGYYEAGEFDKLKNYCLDDVMLTKEIFDYGVKNRKVYYLDSKGKIAIMVDWKKYFEEGGENNDVSLTLPF